MSDSREERPREAGSSGSHLREETSRPLWLVLPIGKPRPPFPASLGDPARCYAGGDGITPTVT